MARIPFKPLQTAFCSRRQNVDSPRADGAVACKWLEPRKTVFFCRRQSVGSARAEARAQRVELESRDALNRDRNRQFAAHDGQRCRVRGDAAAERRE